MHPNAREIFARAHGLRGKEHEAFLSEACGGDVELRLEVQRLLVKSDRVDSFFANEEGDTISAGEFDEYWPRPKATWPASTGKAEEPGRPLN